jgi:diguanylate cyclase (GGDEF)-like protein
MLTLLLSALCAAAPLWAVPRERTFRLITTFDTTQDGGSTQNFDVVQDDRGVMYVANLAGVMEYDGVRWRLIKLPRQVPALGLRVIGGGRIAVLSLSEFGYLERDVAGRMRYVSLSALYHGSLDDLGQGYSVERDGDALVYSWASGDLLRWDGRSVKRIETNDPPRVTAGLHDGFVSTSRGLTRLAGGRLQLVPGGELFANKKVRAVVRRRDGKLLVHIARVGLFLFDGKSVQPFAPFASQRVVRDSFADIVSLPDGRTSITTRRGGVIVIGEDGGTDEIIDVTTGLPDSDINRSFVTADGALWLALENGVVRVDISSPLSVIDGRGGVRNSVQSILRHNGVLYAGSTSALYRIGGVSESASTKVAEQIGVAQRILAGWSMVEVGNEILVGTNDAVYVVPDAGDPIRLEATDSITAYAMLRSTRNPNIVYAGTDRGLLLLRRTSAGWTASEVISSTPPGIRNMVEDRDGSVWLGTSFSGVARVRWSWPPPGAMAGAPVASVQRFGTNSGYPYILAGRLVFVIDDKRFCTLDERTGQFMTDPTFAELGDGDDISAVAEDPEGRIWVSTRGTGVATRGRDGRYHFQPRILGSVPGTGVDVIYPDAEGVVWFGSEHGLVRYDSRAELRPVAPRPPLVRSVTVNGKPLEGARVVHFGGGRLRFELAAASYDGGTVYQYRLDPVDATWSPWITEPFTEFTNLWEGDYRLLVRTKNIRGAISPTTAWSFHVLPPWYRTAWAWILWVGLAVAAVIGVSMLRTHALEKRAKLLEQRVAEQTHELRDAVTKLEEVNAQLEELSFDDPLTGISNRRRFDEVLRAEWARARRAAAPIALIFIDIDLFKLLNDTQGHQVGDDCLVAVARFLSLSVQRSGDLVARYGGEEFALIVPGAELAIAAQFAERLRKGIESLAIRNDGSPNGHLTASFGVVSVIPDAEWTPQDLVAAADRALYTAKADGRNRVATAA